MAHPDDESMGNGGMISRHTRANVTVHLVCATRGGAGWLDRPPGRSEELAQIRSQELRRAAGLLGVASVELWDYPDGAVAKCDRRQVADRIAREIRRIDPDVVVGWGPDGAYGHPDHVAVGACTDVAVLAFAGGERPILYHMALDRENEAGYRAAIDAVGGDGSSVPIVGFDQVSVVFELLPQEVDIKVAAIECHESQIQDWRIALKNPGDLQRKVYGRECYIRSGKLGIQQVLRSELFPEIQSH